MLIHCMITLNTSKESSFTVIYTCNVIFPEAKVLKLSDDKENGGKPVVNGNSGPPENVRCETCSAVFDNLVQFMDHRNFECEAGNTLIL